MEKKEKILLVDDEADFLDLMTVRLEANNFSVVTASTGEEALQKFKKENPSAVILDILMPGLSGIDVLEKIRKENRYTPVFIVTAFTNEERLKLANKFNATGFILKTDNLKDMVSDVNEAIRLVQKYKG